MSFAGLSLAQLVPIVLGFGGAITGLYLLRMRRRRVVVPFAALWQRVARESESRRIWRKLRRLVSWLVQILVLLLFAFALGDPRPNVWLREPRTVAIVVDRSASMAGVSADGDGPRRIDAARGRAIAEARALGPVDRALVIAAGEEVSVVAPLSRDAGVLVPAIESLEPSHGEADFTRALALAAHSVGEQAGPRIVVLTDGAVDAASRAALEACVAGPIPCDVVPFGGPVDNLAITAFAARRYPNDREHVEVLAEVRNLGDAPAVVDLDIEAEGVSVGRRRLELGPGASVREVLGEVDAARTELVARLEGTALGPAFDDVAYAVVPPLKPLDVVLVGDGSDLFLEAALLTLGDHVRLSSIPAASALRILSDAAEANDPEAARLAEAELVLFDVGAAELPPRLPDAHVVLFDPWRHEDSPCPIAKKADVVRPFLTEQARKHPVLEHVVLKDVNIARGTTFVAEPGDTVLVRSLGEPVVVLREDVYVVIALGFDPRQSDLALRTAFPLLVDNIVRYVERRTPGFVAAAPLGQSRELALADLGLDPNGVTRVRVTAPDGASREVPVLRGRFRLRALVPGIYAIAGVDGSAGVVAVAVNQASVEASDLHDAFARARTEGTIAAAVAPEPAPTSEGPLWTAIVLLAATILALEWATYHRRVTV